MSISVTSLRACMPCHLADQLVDLVAPLLVLSSPEIRDASSSDGLVTESFTLSFLLDNSALESSGQSRMCLTFPPTPEGCLGGLVRVLGNREQILRDGR